jgi:triacylglycerol esterase/lipase EstA (alpha/beta hydrolase family)
LTSDLLQADIGQLPDCPVIMVGHSFGGLVIKQLYCYAHEKLHSSREGFEKAKLEKFLGNIRGVFYYATPHRGSKLMDNLAKTVESHPLLKCFQTLSTDAAILNEKFDKIVGSMGGWKNLDLQRASRQNW